MLNFLGSTKTLCDGVTRRDMLKVGALAVGGLTLADVLRAEQAAGSNGKSAKSVIMVYMCGAPGHQDMYDLKMNAPAEIRGEFRPIPTNVPGIEICEHMPRMAAIMALAPLVAPLLGGVFETLFGWRSNFVALFCFGAVGWLMLWFLLPETLRQRAPEPVSVGSTLRSYRRFLGNPSFVCHLGIVACCLSGLFAWISASAFVVQDIYGYSAMAFGLAFAVSA
jgi:hypothetical protein